MLASSPGIHIPSDSDRVEMLPHVSPRFNKAPSTPHVALSYWDTDHGQGVVHERPAGTHLVVDPCVHSVCIALWPSMHSLLVAPLHNMQVR